VVFGGVGGRRLVDEEGSEFPVLLDPTLSQRRRKDGAPVFARIPSAAADGNVGTVGRLGRRDGGGRKLTCARRCGSVPRKITCAGDDFLPRTCAGGGWLDRIGLCGGGGHDFSPKGKRPVNFFTGRFGILCFF
jgi:hypothetical protein